MAMASPELLATAQPPSDINMNDKIQALEEPIDVVGDFVAPSAWPAVNSLMS